MCSAYAANECVLISACLFNGSIYLCSLDTTDLSKRKHRTKQENRFCAWGYKFEQNMLSDSPNTKPDIQKPVIENEEFSLFYESTLGSHNLIYGAQIDGLLATINKELNPPVATNTDYILTFLRNSDYLELKNK